MTSPLRIALAGFGTVGQGTLDILRRNASLLTARAGRPIEVAAIALRDPTKPREVSLNGIRVTSDTLSLASAPDVDVMVELIGGSEGIARQLVEAAIANGKHVVTANKALLAHHGLALAKAAEAKGVALAFEAAVAGGIPIIGALRTGLAGNQVTRVAGILNGTCNYILTTMEREQRDFAQVLADAQALGYAEADPSFDVDGIDAAHKLTLLAALAFGTQPDFHHVHTQGIRPITLQDIEAAASFGYRIKLLGIATMEKGALSQSVQPCLVPTHSPLGVIDGAFNAVQVEGDAVGRVVLEGRGAGGGPTGSAVVADLLAIARSDRFPAFTIAAEALRPIAAANAATHEGSYYLRLTLKDETGVLAEVTRVFAAEKISVHSITQHVLASSLPRAGGSEGGNAQVIVLTHATSEAAITRAAQAIGALPISQAAPLLLRMEV